MKFSSFQLDQRLPAETDRQGFTDATPIQEQCIPPIQEGRDVVDQSGTGSGKTLAFALPMLEKIKPGRGVQALVLTPTRELCVQVTQVLHDFGKIVGLKTTSIYGGVSYNPQVEGLRRAEIVVGTPGRILDHLKQRTANFSHVIYLVLDEADKMLEMGFIEDVEEIISYIPRERQTVLFSATIPQEILKITQKYMRLPLVVQTQTYVDKSLLHQAYYDVPSKDKFSLLVFLLKQKTAGLALVFCATRHEADIVALNLHKQGVHALAIHGGLSQHKRLHALDSLRNQDIDVLVATDVAARGLDIKNVSHVYNYDVPKSPDDYIHRIGRTARAGEEGDAVTLLSDRDYDNFRRVLSDRSLQIENASLPPFERVQFMRQREDRGATRRPSYGQRGGYHRDSGRPASSPRREFGDRRSAGRASFGERRPKPSRSYATKRSKF